MKKRRYQIAALMMSVIIATGSLSGSVFAAETSGDTAESSVVEEIAETGKSETDDEKADEGSETESDQETEELTEDTSQETEESVEDTQNLDEKEEDLNQSVPEDIENTTEEEQTDSFTDTVDTPVEETDTMETSEEGKEDNQSVTTTPSEQENFNTDNLDSEQSTDENVVDSGSCGKNATWVLTGTDNNLTLIISGSGDMDNFSEDNIPWASRRSKVKTLVVEDGITSIGNYNFYSLNKLEEVSIPDSVMSIGNNSFSNCTSLSAILIPEGVTSISKSSFQNCSSLTSFTIPDNVTSIGSSAFFGCSRLISVTIPDSVTSIGNDAFSGCSSLVSFTFPDSVTSISENTFRNCSSLTSFMIPDGVTNIGYYAFSGCNGLTSVVIPDSVTRISSYAFQNCSNLTSLTIPDNVTSISDNTFSNCSSLTSFSIPNGVTSIGNGAFSGCSSLTSVVIPDSVTRILSSAFYGCSSLTSVVIPDGVARIGYDAFYGCSSLTSVVIPDSVTSISENTFRNCSSLTSVTIPDSVTSIEDCAFFKCSRLTSVTIPDSVTSIGFLAFGECSSLASFTIPDSITSISRSTFSKCTSLTSMTIPDSVTSIESGAFSGCSSLTSVTIPDSVTSIGSSAFDHCSSLTSVTIPDSVKSIEEREFYCCESLTSVTIPDSVKSIEPYAFYMCINLTGVTIPDSVTSIGSYAFYDCYRLTSVTIPDSVTSIGSYAFYYCYRLTNVTIPDSVTIIGDNAFNSKNLIIYFRGTEAQWDNAVRDSSIEYKSIFYNYFSVDASFELSGTSFLYTGNEIKPLVTVTYDGGVLVEGTDYELLYENNINAGTAIVTITGKGNYSGIFPAAEFTINPASIETAEVSGIEDKIYNRREQTQTAVVKVGSTTLKEETDYTVSYKNNTNVGTATVTIKGKGNYTGIKTVTFTINPASIETAEVSSIEDKTYNGSAQTQTPVVKVGSTTLKEGTDYTISYRNNVNAGIATVDLTGIGNYTGEISKTFTIAKATQNLNVVADSHIILVGKTTNVSASGAKETSEYTFSSSDSAVATVDSSGVVIGKEPGTVTITVSTAETSNYKAGSKTVDITVNEIAISGYSDKIYNGQPQTQSPVVKLNGTALTEGIDYTISYSNNVNAGKATMTITGIGQYEGITTSTSFTVAKASQNLNVKAGASNIEIGKTTKVTASGAKETTEYTFTSSDTNIAEVDAEGTVTGKAVGDVIITVRTAATTNYEEGSETVEINVKKVQKIRIDNYIISGLANRTYNGQLQTQKPVVKPNETSETALTEGTDYTVSYVNNKNAGTATVTITGMGDYEGTASATFTIAKAAQNFTVKAVAPSIDIGKTTKVTTSGAKEKPKFTFTSSNAKVATVDASGTVTGKAAGTVTITVKAAATANHKELSKTVKITVNKVLKKPGNCHFTKWNNSKYTGCRISWNKVDGAEGYQTLLSWTDGSHSSATIVKSNVLYRDCTVHPQHVSQMKVRAFYTLNGQRKYGPWSNLEYITPSPAKLTTKNASSGSNLKMNISWNIIYGCNGYNVFITTNPNGKWYWNQSTTEKATATSASIDKCGGAKLKKNTRYYVRIVTRRKRNGVFCTVPMPANNTYIGSFVIK